jgi:ubiquinol-cytochrome c reductase cytochrome b subunit
MSGWREWLDQRTGAVTAARRVLFEGIPGGARWRHVWGKLVLFTFLVQVVTGFFLLAHYSASAQTAWESVFHLQHQISGGGLLRGLHSVAAQIFVVVLALHLMQVILCRAYLAPREVSYWLLLLLLPLAVGLSVTGWLLPYDQKGFWAARVPLNILGIVPVVGPGLQKVLIGGSDFGHLTLTRFAALHTVLLPLLTGAVLATGVYLGCRHGLAASPRPDQPAQCYWPDQAIRDAVACLAVLATALFVVLLPKFTGTGEPGVELAAPADPSETYAAARPEWFMLWLFQFLKLFPSGSELWGAVILPGLTLVVLAAMPWLGRWKFGAVFNTGFILALAAGAGALLLSAVQADRADPHYQAAVREASAAAQRVRVLASGPQGIPAAGALSLVRDDPYLQGPQLFARHCASCHRYDGHDGLGATPKDAPTASDLKGFASREWITGLLDPAKVSSSHYFGGTRFADGKMARFVKKDLAGLPPDRKVRLQTAIIAVSAEAGLKSQRARDTRDAAVIAQGRELITSGDVRCTECHQFRKPDEDAVAPDLTGYGSRAWLIRFMGNPAAPHFYGARNDRMPAFGNDKVLTPAAIGLIADWLRGEWYDPAEESGNSVAGTVAGDGTNAAPAAMPLPESGPGRAGSEPGPP